MDYRYARQSTGWFYLFFTPFIHVVYRLLFRKIYLHNRQIVKPNTPILLAANHPTAFIDPIFFTSFFDPPVYNMTRGDVFRNPIFRKFLMSCNMFPVFRQRDGYQGRDRNDEVFEFCQQKLLSGVTVNIFVEGEHHLDKRVLSPQKGIARIAFGTYERHRLDDLQIVPVGCNYVNGDCTRDEAKIIVGTPLFVKDYWPAYEQNPAAAINQLCQDIHKSLKLICYQIEDRADDALAEQLLSLWRNDHPAGHLPIVEYQAPRFWGEKALLDRLNEMALTEKQRLRDCSTEYFFALDKAGLTDEGLKHPEYASRGWLLFLIFASPIAILGFSIGWPVRWLVYRIAHKVVKKREFYTSVLMGMGVVVGGLYFAGILITGLLTDMTWLVTLSLLMPLLAWVSVFWKETLVRWNEARKANAHMLREQLLTLRKDVWNLITK
ncbi:MAG: 1-acyl-sn-glycerol-3-phosphate acyltransferase [Lewinellaceae bacterium]|nr:1-acyl-sn-glycerol-3-phosphate acyltransferase [Lewinellaceae bacterium]